MGDNVTEFDHVSTEELRERAVELARRQWDVRFFWRLLGLIPAAEAIAGNTEASKLSVAQASGFLYEALSVETDPKVQEALRPFYISYLLEHGEAGSREGSGEDSAKPATGEECEGGGNG